MALTGRLHTFSIFLFGMGLAGCISTGDARLFNDATVAQIKPGETTKGQVIALLGEPTYQREATMSGHAYEWWGYAAEQSTVNPLDYLLLVGLFFNGIGTPDDRRDLHLFFDPDGVLTHVHQQMTAYETGGLWSSLNVTSKTTNVLGRGGQPDSLTSYQNVMAVDPGP